MTEHDTGDAAWAETTTPPVTWVSGRWRLELRDEEIADIEFDGRPVLRSIRGVARDRDWGTIPPRVISVDRGGDRIAINVSLVGRDADIAARLVVEADGDTLQVRWDGTLGAPFLRARLGLVVLHPPFLAGEPLQITHSDSSVEHTTYPLEISPHQPAFDIRALSWQHHGLSAAVEFDGDVFEMEDQRNWTDASYKTYSTPLALPFPVQLEAGLTVSQGITICCSAPAPIAVPPVAPRIRMVDTGRNVPSVGTSASTGPTVSEPMPVGTTLLVELPAHTEAWRAALDRAVIEAHGLPLDVRVVGAASDRLDEVLDALSTLEVARIGAFTADTHVSEPELYEQLETGIQRRGLAIPIVGGTRAHFTELNRTLHRLPADIAEYTFSITPQMHATGQQQLVESIAMQRLVAENAVRLTGGPVHIGPVTLRSRFNAVATTRTPDADVVDLRAGYNAAVTPDATDCRQQSGALLAWTVASAAALAVPGVASISWFEASGPRGLRDADGTSFPVEIALEWLAEIAGSPLLEVAANTGTAEANSGLWAVGARSGETSIVLLANLRTTPVATTLMVDAQERLVELAPLAARRIVFR